MLQVPFPVTFSQPGGIAPIYYVFYSLTLLKLELMALEILVLKNFCNANVLLMLITHTILHTELFL